MITQCYLPLPRKRLPDGASPDWGCAYLIAAYYSFIYPERMKGWVGLERESTGLLTSSATDWMSLVCEEGVLRQRLSSCHCDSLNRLTLLALVNFVKIYRYQDCYYISCYTNSSQVSVARYLRSGGTFKNYLLQIYLCVCPWKNFENRSIFSEVMDKSVQSPFWLTLYNDLTINNQFTRYGNHVGYILYNWTDIRPVNHHHHRRRRYHTEIYSAPIHTAVI